MKGKSITALVLSLAVTVSAIPTGSFADHKFKDIKDSYWANEAINSLVNTGIFNGYPDGKFGPEDSMTREEFAVILYKAFDLEAASAATNTFKDVEPSRWSYSYIEAAKPYLTGYFPPNGKPSFDPNGIATREDVAVALVSVLHLNKLSADNVADLYFNDAEDVSPKLRDEIALAVRYDLIKGFPDNTFRPDKPITRAQAASLIFKVLKSTYQEENASQAYKITVPERVNTPKVPISVQMPKGTELYINNELVADETSNYNKTWSIASGVGTEKIEFKLVFANGKVVKETKTVVYEMVTPELAVDNMQDKVNTESIKVYGTVYNKGDLTTKLYVNDKWVAYNLTSGRFEVALKLVSGENKINFKVVNESGRVSQVTKTVYCTPAEAEAPKIAITNMPEKSGTQTIEYTLRITDKYDKHMDLYINDKRSTIRTGVDYVTPVTLVKGDNKLVFKTTNSKGKQTVVEKHILFSIGAPVIELTSPVTTDSQYYQLALKATDANYRYNQLSATVNGRKVSIDYRGVIKYDMELNLGLNLINVEVTNPDGQSAKTAYQVNYQVKPKEAPKLNVYVPETTGLTSGSSITITGNVYDVEDPNVKVTVNGEAVTVSKSGNFSKTIGLLSGDNVVLIKATNIFGVVTEIKKILKIQ